MKPDTFYLFLFTLEQSISFIPFKRFFSKLKFLFHKKHYLTWHKHGF